jgi:hypothetical protein
MEFNVSPYNDDFESNAKDNNYLRILFKPGYAVQARELTQIQSILQNQIKALGDHIFQDGSPVIGGNISLDNTVAYIKLDETYKNEDIEVDSFVSQVIIRSADSEVQAKVLAAYFPSGGTPTLLIKYLSGEEFVDGDIFKIAGTTTEAKLIDSNASGKGSVASINDGIFYCDGYFVQVNQETVVIDAYTQSANVKVGLEISDDVIDYLVDSTLLDPAQGSFNYQAPGADRYQFNLNLTTRPLATSVDESKFFELMRVENGLITKQVKYPVYAELEKTLARRTFDESGDYTVTPFRVTAANTANSSKYALEIEPGKAYVKGFEFETLGKIKIEGDKPRLATDTRSMIEVDIGAPYGNYIQVKRVFGSNAGDTFLDTGAIETLDLHCVSSEKVNVAAIGGSVANSMFYANTKIGTARVRNLKRYQQNQEGNNIDSNGVYNLYLTDVDIKPFIFLANNNSGTSNSILLPNTAAPIDNAYTNMTVTILPIQMSLNALATVNTTANTVTVVKGANVLRTGPASWRNVFNVGDIVRIKDDIRRVVRVGPNQLTVNSGITFTYLSDVGGNANIFMTKQVAYSSNVTGRTANVINYLGSNNTLYLDALSAEDYRVIKNSVVQIMPALKDVESVIEGGFTSASVAKVNASANVYAGFKDARGDVPVGEPNYKSLIFRLPKEYVKYGTLTNVTYDSNKYIEESSNSIGVFEISPGKGLTSDESIEWAVTNNNIEDNLVIVVKDKGASSIPNGSILHLTTSNVASVTNGVKITADPALRKVAAYVRVKQNNVMSRIRTKEFKSNTQYSLDTFNYPGPAGVTIDHTVTVGDVGTVAQINVQNGLVFLYPSITDIGASEAISLFVPDVVKVRKILKGTRTAFPTVSAYTDITEQFNVDTGQRDEMYDHAKIILKQGFPSPNARMTVHCDFYTHNYISGNTFFCVDSYPQSQYENGTIPVFNSTKYGVFPLRDCLDFRPTRTIGVPIKTYDVGLLPDPDSTIESSFDYYLPRIDKLVLSKTKEFKIIKGVSSSAPIPPEDDSDSMTMYVVYLPPYVHNINEIKLKYIENKRYTMKDISAMDKRLDQIDYYTSLSNIENLALTDSTTYKDLTKKEKFGIVGENFVNYNVADYKNKDFSASKTKRGLTARVVHRVYDMQPYSYTNVKNNTKTITLDFTETPAISQPLCSAQYVQAQPFLFATFIGDMTLSPELDFWVSEQLKPEIIKAPETVTIIKETTEREVIREILVEKEIIVTCPNPTTNADTSIADVGQDLEDSPADTIILVDDEPAPVLTDVTQTPVVPQVPPEEIGTIYIPSVTGIGQGTVLALSEDIFEGIVWPSVLVDPGASASQLNFSLPSDYLSTLSTVNLALGGYTEPTIAYPEGIVGGGDRSGGGGGTPSGPTRGK